jgi:tetratricopeptide (TPR) repeat protein
VAAYTGCAILTLGGADFKTNHAAGEALIHQGKLAEAIPYLERAWQIDPTNYANAWDLALAYFRTGNLAGARRQITSMLARQNTAELHNLLGDVEERAGNRAEAARQYQEAARAEPNEKNLADWGSFLLRCQALDEAVEIYRHAVEMHPRSSQLRVGLAVAYYTRREYDSAVETLCQAIDVDPADLRPMTFLVQMYDISPGMAEEVTRRFAKFVQLYPNNALAQLYYGLSLWKQGQADMAAVENRLKAALALDPGLKEAHLQLGQLYEQEHKDAEAIHAYQAALRLDPAIESAHYRLARLYQRSGQNVSARKELEIYQRLHQQKAAPFNVKPDAQ